MESENVSCVSISKKYCHSFSGSEGCMEIKNCILYPTLPDVDRRTKDYKSFKTIKGSDAVEEKVE